MPIHKNKSQKTIFLKDQPSVSFVFPTLNGKTLITSILNSIKNQTYPSKKIEVIVVDNHSSDGTVQLIRKKFPWVKLIELKTNTGSAYPITVGAKIAKGDYILATNDDVVFEKNCLHWLINLILSDSTIGIVTGKMLNLKPPHKLAIPGFRINPWLGYQPYDLKKSHCVRKCDWAPGACVLISKTLLKKVGYFDNGYIFCGDDYDVCFQVKALGYKIMYTPKAVFYHVFSRSGGKARPTQINLFCHYRGKFRYALKNSTPPQILTTFISQILFGPIYTYFFFRNKTFFPMFKALVWNMKHLRQTIKARQKAKKLTRVYKIN